MSTKPRPPLSTGMLLLQMALFVIIGSPLVAFVWETVNELLTLHVSLTRVLLAVPALLVLVGLLVLMARTVQRWTA